MSDLPVGSARGMDRCSHLGRRKEKVGGDHHILWSHSLGQRVLIGGWPGGRQDIAKFRLS